MYLDKLFHNKNIIYIISVIVFVSFIVLDVMCISEKWKNVLC